MKKTISILLCILMMVMLFAGCGETPATDVVESEDPATESTVPSDDQVESVTGFTLPDPPESPALIQFAGGASGGTFFLISNAVAQVLNQKYSEYVKCSTQATSEALRY